MNQINCFLFPEPSFLSYHETHRTQQHLSGGGERAGLRLAPGASICHETHRTQQHLSGVGSGVGSDWPQEPPFAKSARWHSWTTHSEESQVILR